MNSNDTIEINLTQGQTALVDVSTVDIVGQYNWCAVWSPSSHAYYAVRKDTSEEKHRTVRMHRFIWESINGPIPGKLEIDHINGNPLDNRIENLRLVTTRRNQHNRKDQRDGKTSSKYPGVSWQKNRKKWQAHIRVNGRLEYLGMFDQEEEAYKAYQQVLIDIGG